MPLMKGSGKKAIKENIRREIAHGKPKDQAIASAYEMAGKSKAKRKKNKKGAY